MGSRKVHGKKRLANESEAHKVTPILLSLLASSLGLLHSKATWKVCQAWEEFFAAWERGWPAKRGKEKPVWQNRVQKEPVWSGFFVLFVLGAKTCIGWVLKVGGSFRMCRIPPSIKSRLQRGFVGYLSSYCKPRKTGQNLESLGKWLELQSFWELTWNSFSYLQNNIKRIPKMQKC